MNFIIITINIIYNSNWWIYIVKLFYLLRMNRYRNIQPSRFTVQPKKNIKS